MMCARGYLDRRSMVRLDSWYLISQDQEETLRAQDSMREWVFYAFCCIGKSKWGNFRLFRLLFKLVRSANFLRIVGSQFTEQ